MPANSKEPPSRDTELAESALGGFPPVRWQAKKFFSGSTGSYLELSRVHIRVAGPGQAFLVVPTAWGADAAIAARATYREIARLLQEWGLAIVQERLFGSLTARASVLAARNAALSAAGISPASPFTYIQGQPPWGEGLAGVIIRAVSCRHSQDKVWTIRDQGQPVGRGWRQGDANFLVLQNLQGLFPNGNGANAPPHQASLGMGTLAFNNMSGIGRSGTGVLKVDGKEVPTQKMERTIPFILQWDENLDVGSDTGTPVDDRDYQVPFKFTGKIKKITLTIHRPKLSPGDIKKLEAAQRSNRTSE
jgi:arylsulfatase